MLELHEHKQISHAEDFCLFFVIFPMGHASHFAGTILKTLTMMQKQELKELAANRFSELPVFFLPLGLFTSFVTEICICTFSVDPDPDRIRSTYSSPSSSPLN